MTREDSPSDDARDEPEDVGGFKFGMADGSGDPEDDAGATDSRNFLGFDFGRWLRETNVRPSTETEPEPVETTDADVAGGAADAGPTFEGFDFRQWMADEDVGPRKPPENPRVVGATPTADRSGLSGLLAALPFAGSTPEDTYEGGFDFAEWLGEGDADFYEPVDVEPATTTATSTRTPEPSATATAAAAGGSGGFGETPEFPGPTGGGISDTPPVKLAALALFTAALVAVALTAAGAIAPLGPANGFGSPGGGDGAQEQPVGTNNSTATDTDEQTPQDTPTSTPTETAAPTPEPTSTPTPEPTPSETATPAETATETPTETATPTPTENGSDDGSGGILDPIFGGSSSSSDDSLIDL